VRRFLARRAPRLRLRGFDTLRLFDARRRLRLAEREEEDAALRLETLAEEADGARGFDAARRRRRAFRFTLPRRFLAARLLRELLRGAGDGFGAGAFGTDERLLRRRREAVDRDLELRLRLAERDRELRERRERDEAEALDEGALGVELRRRRRDEERLRERRLGFFTFFARGFGDADNFRLAFLFA